MALEEKAARCGARHRREAAWVWPTTLEEEAARHDTHRQRELGKPVRRGDEGGR
jgi:hypothetical protein